MNTPPFLLAATLLFWGWQIGLPWLGALLALAIESPRLIRARWNFAQADLDRIFNLCVLLFLGAVVVVFVANDGARVVADLANENNSARRLSAINKGARSFVVVLQWLPLTFLPIALAQAFSEKQSMHWSTFSVWLRRKRKVGNDWPSGNGLLRIDSESADGLNVGWPYYVVCLLAASAANERTLWFSAGLAVLVGWASWTRRSRSFPPVAWAASLVLAVGLGFAAQLGLRELQGLMRKFDAALIARFASGRGFEPKEHRTSLGAIGQLKLSGSIVLRVEAEGTPPPLLREASYNLLRSPTWAISRQKQDFSEINSELDLTTWLLITGQVARQTVTVSGFLPGGQGLLAVPLGTSKVEDLPADKFQTNTFGVLNVAEGPGFVRFRAHYDEGRSIDSPPDRDDLDIPATERLAVNQVADELGLTNLPPTEAMARVARYFTEHFSYSTWVQIPRWRRRSNDSALTEFLLKTKAGHCEYFATATVMLLRAAGIPARYAVGYSVQEKKGNEWIVRERHGHAWCLAWVNGAWRDVDNTPPGWNDIEAARASSWERFTDAWSAIWFRFSEWRWGKGEWKRYVLWLLVPLFALVTWRLMKQKQWRRTQGAGASTSALARLGLDSEFFLIERRLTELGLERHPDETLRAWLARLQKSGRVRSAELKPLLDLHNRLRFDPAGLGGSERRQLKSEVEAWLGDETRISRIGTEKPG